jgi:predicted Holliday junction resolvase-like endonuclease
MTIIKDLSRTLRRFDDYVKDSIRSSINAAETQKILDLQQLEWVGDANEAKQLALDIYLYLHTLEGEIDQANYKRKEVADVNAEIADRLSDIRQVIADGSLELIMGNDPKNMIPILKTFAQNKDVIEESALGLDPDEIRSIVEGLTVDYDEENH